MSNEQFDALAWAKRAAEALRACHNWMQGEFSDSDFDRDGKLSEADAAAFSAAYDADRAIAAIALMRGQPDMALVPRELTAENGAKVALIGEFTTPFVMRCLECTDGFVDDEVCDDCDGAGSFTVRVPVEWTTIKDIHKAMIAHFHPAPKDTADEQ